MSQAGRRARAGSPSRTSAVCRQQVSERTAGWDSSLPDMQAGCCLSSFLQSSLHPPLRDRLLNDAGTPQISMRTSVITPPRTADAKDGRHGVAQAADLAGRARLRPGALSRVELDPAGRPQQIHLDQRRSHNALASVMGTASRARDVLRKQRAPAPAPAAVHCHILICSGACPNVSNDPRPTSPNSQVGAPTAGARRARPNAVVPTTCIVMSPSRRWTSTGRPASAAVGELARQQLGRLVHERGVRLQAARSALAALEWAAPARAAIPSAVTWQCKTCALRSQAAAGTCRRIRKTTTQAAAGSARHPGRQAMTSGPARSCSAEDVWHEGSRVGEIGLHSRQPLPAAPAGEEHGLPGGAQRLVLLAARRHDAAGLECGLAAPEQRRERRPRGALQQHLARESRVVLRGRARRAARLGRLGSGGSTLCGKPSSRILPCSCGAQGNPSRQLRAPTLATRQQWPELHT